jgi:hypothetical protein
MHYNDTRTGTATLGSWTLEFFETTGVAGYLCSSVEISLNDERKARLSLTRPNLPVEDVNRQLTTRAEQWITEYQERKGEASTGFGLL